MAKAFTREKNFDTEPTVASDLKESLLPSEEPLTVSFATRKALAFGLPSIICLFESLLVETANQIFVGQLGVPALTAAIGLGNMVLNTFCVSVAIGFNGALDTLVSQAFGNGQYRMCGVYMNRARVINVAFFVPICIVLFLTEEILLAFGQDSETAS